jgi:hypothetical protein
MVHVDTTENGVLHLAENAHRYNRVVSISFEAPGLLIKLSRVVQLLILPHPFG